MQPLGALWRFLRRRNNRVVLGWFGGGLAALATAAWAVFTHLDQPAASSAATEASCEATAVQGLAVGCGDLITGDVNIRGGY